MESKDILEVKRDEDGKFALSVAGLDEFPEEAKSKINQLFAILDEVKNTIQPSPERIAEIFQQIKNLCPPEMMVAFNSLFVKAASALAQGNTVSPAHPEEVFGMLEDIASVGNSQAGLGIFDPEAIAQPLHKFIDDHVQLPPD